ncbi:hypothetical protein MKY41_11480 [Sporosarcina sp. FSL W7-1349]|uniref:hypothetical protein n=1 Tax=Sporosarcina sp. FSL W7-1349 TaxID=2921561 RepID=UPI0030F79B17
MRIGWPKGFAEWGLAIGLVGGITKWYLSEHPTNFQFLVILLLLAIFNRLKEKKVTKRTHYFEIKDCKKHMSDSGEAR